MISIRRIFVVLAGVLLLLVLGTVIANAEVVFLDTPFEKETSMILPATLEESHALLIRVAELYWGERYDLENSLENVAKLTNEVGNLLGVIDALESQNTVLMGLLDESLSRKGLRILSVGVNAGMFRSPYFQIGVGYEMFVFNWLTVGVQVEYPLTIGVTIGTAW